MTPVRPMAVGWGKERHTTHKRGFSSFMAVGWSKQVLRLFANGLPLDMKDSSREHSETQGQRCARQCSHPVLKTWQTSKRAHTDEQPRAPRIKRDKATDASAPAPHAQLFLQELRCDQEARSTCAARETGLWRRRQGGSYAEAKARSTRRLIRGEEAHVC